MQGGGEKKGSGEMEGGGEEGGGREKEGGGGGGGERENRILSEGKHADSGSSKHVQLYRITQSGG